MSSPNYPEAEPELDHRVLYVEDDPGYRAVLPVLLVAKGYQVETARDGNEAWIRICAAMQRVSKGYDLLITALDMPRLNGIELIRRVRHAGFPVRILVFAENLTPERRIELGALVVDAAVEKGIESETLLNLVRRLTVGAHGG